MVNLTVAISESLRDKLQEHKEVNWSAVTRRALEEHLKRIGIIESIASKSKLTQKDAEELTRKVKREMARQHGLVKD